MAHAEGAIVINRPAGAIFAFLLDGMNNPLWRPAVTDIARVPGTPDGVGAVFKQGLKGPGGRRIDGDYEVVECRPDDRLAFRVIAGPARPAGTYQLDAAGDATRVRFALHYEPKGIARLMDPIIERTMRSEIATLSRLKAYLERQQPN